MLDNLLDNYVPMGPHVFSSLHRRIEMYKSKQVEELEEMLRQMKPKGFWKCFKSYFDQEGASERVAIQFAIDYSKLNDLE